MSFFGNIGNAIKKGVVDVGHFVGNVATNPIVKGLGAGALALTGVGIPASAAILGGSQLAGNLLKPGGNIGKGIQGGLGGAAEGALAGTVGKGIKSVTGMTGLQGIEHMLGIGQAGGDAGSGGDQSQYVLNDDGSIKTDENGDPVMNPNAGQSDNQGGGGGDEQNILGKINDIAKKVPGVSSIESMLGGAGGGGLNLGNLGQLGLAGLEGYNAINLGKKSSDYAQQAMDAVKQNYDQRQPLRLAGLQGMLNPQTNDISSITKNSGPYGAGLPAVKPVPGVTLPAGYKVT